MPEEMDDEPEDLDEQKIPAEPAQPAEEPKRFNVFDRLNIMFGI